MQEQRLISGDHIQASVGQQTIWKPKIIAKMRELAAQDLTTRQIADKLNYIFRTGEFNRHKVLGKCHRLGIQLQGSTALARRADMMGVLCREPVPANMCQWPIGEEGDADYRYCGAEEVVAGRPYCLTHCKEAYIDFKEQ